MALLDPFLWGLARPTAQTAKRRRVAAPSRAAADEPPAEPPKSGDKCLHVWEIAEAMHRADPNCRRRDVHAECVRQGINPSTARTQYQRWWSSRRG